VELKMSKFFVRIFAVLLFAAIFANGQDEPKRYAVITVNSEIVRASIEPGANMVMMARKGHKFEVLGEPGVLWLKVKTKSGDGYIQTASCKVVLGSNHVGTIILLFVLLGAVGGGVYVFYKKKGILRKENDNN
jgi:hypothetical protein